MNIIMKILGAEIITGTGVLIVYFSDAPNEIKIAIISLGLATSILAFFAFKREMKDYEKKENLYKIGA
jgi:hypothetical protein